MPGPVPNHSSDLARPRERRGKHEQPLTIGVRRATEQPEPDPDWHPIATQLWVSLGRSGQSDFYQDSDWAFAYSLCEDLSLYKKPLVNSAGEEYFKRSGQMLQTIYSAMERLLVAEGDRRRVRLELAEAAPTGPSAALVVMDDYRAGLEQGPAEPSPAT